MLLDRNSAVPLYYQIHQQLFEQIQSGELKPGQPIPSEQEISSRMGVSRMTARQALKSLCDAGAAYSRRGVGTFVAAQKQEKTASKLLSFTEEMKARDRRPTSQVLKFEKIAPESEVAVALHLTQGEKVLSLLRVRLADAVPMGVENSFLPVRLFPNLQENFDPKTSLYQSLADRYGVRMSAADEVVEAGLASAEHARILKIKKNAPVFFLTRVSYADNGQPVEYVRSTYRGDRWKIVSRLTATSNSDGEVREVKRMSLPLSPKEASEGTAAAKKVKA
jgi:GntR family transcriptional regulator